MNKKLFVILSVIYRIILDITYVLEISPFFDYARLVNEKTAESSMMSWWVFAIITICVLPFIKREKDEFISSVVVMLYLIRAVPFTSYIQFTQQPFEFIFLNIVFWILLLTILNSNVFNIRIKSRKYGGIIMCVALISIISVIIVSGVYAHFRIQLSFEDVYDLREEAREYSMPTLLAYLYAATGNVIPILIVYYILAKKKWMVVALLLVGVLSFGVAGQKSTIFKIFACIAMLYYVKIDLRKFILPLMIFICIIVLSEYFIYQETTLAWLISRRMFYVPNMIDTLYYDYISQHGPLYFDTSASGDLAFKLSDIYLNRDGGRSNNGLFSDAYTNLGGLGVLVFPVIFAVILKSFSSVLAGQNKSIIVFSAFIISTTLNGSFISRSLMTHGLLLMFAVLLVMPNTNSEEPHIINN